MQSDAAFQTWQTRMAPLMYDAMYHHNLHWPTQACRWGGTFDENQYLCRSKLYFSEQTDGSEPQKLIMANVDVMKPHVCSSEVVSSWQEFQKCAYIKDQKVVYHPGEVNKIREVPQHPEILMTHADCPEVFVWNMEHQPNRGREKASGKGPSTPDLKLIGHESEALFPLACASKSTFVASGGSDTLVLLWSLEDSMETLLSGSGGSAASPPATTPGKGAKGGSKDTCPELSARTKLTGHTATVEDVIFKPDSNELLVSVGDDQMVLFWDTRAGTSPTQRIEEAHGPGQDIQCVDWEGQTGYWVATGAMDGSLRTWDLRKLGGGSASASNCVRQFNGFHTGGIIRLEWHPHETGVFASGGEDKLINVWRIDPTDAATRDAGPDAGAPPELLFQHTGHRRGKVVDFQWHPSRALPWTMLSVSDDAEDEQIGGGSLQIWRINHLIYEDEDKVVAELDKYTNFVLNGEEPPELQLLDAPTKGAAAAAAAGTAAAPPPPPPPPILGSEAAPAAAAADGAGDKMDVDAAQAPEPKES